jgi:signal transduction histidine kinase
MTITTRVVLAIAIATIAAVVAIFTLTEQQQEEAIAGRVAEAVTAAMEAGGRERCEADPQRFVARSEARAAPRRERRLPRDGRFAPLVGARFAVFAADGASAGPLPSLDAAMLARLDAEHVVALPAASGGPARFLVRMPWDEGPCAIVGVERPGTPDVVAARRRGLVLSLVVLAVASLAAVLALRSPLSRLRALTEAAGSLARSGFRDRGALDRATTSPASKDEVGALGASLREAVDRIAEDATRLAARDAALTEYVAHTTHDLMTPVTVLTGHLAELEDDLARGKSVDRRTVERAIGEAHYLATLVANLGVVARLDRPDPIVQKRALDLREVLERVAARHEPLARAKGLSLEHAVPDDAVPFEGDDLLLERALGNLVHNAIRHHRSRDGAEGHVALVLSKGTAERGPSLRVLDDGAGLDDATLRALATDAPSDDAARTRSHGFGMDVVRRVAALHGLAVVVERAEEGGLSVTLARPATGRGVTPARA